MNETNQHVEVAGSYFVTLVPRLYLSVAVAEVNKLTMLMN